MEVFTELKRKLKNMNEVEGFFKAGCANSQDPADKTVN